VCESGQIALDPHVKVRPEHRPDIADPLARRLHFHLGENIGDFAIGSS
jgi:hypothetical protein